MEFWIQQVPSFSVESVAGLPEEPAAMVVQEDVPTDEVAAELVSSHGSTQEKGDEEEDPVWELM